MKRAIRTEKAPGAIGPYSQGIEAAGLVWASGQIPIDPATGAIVAGGIEVETRRALENARAILEAAGSSLALAVKVVVYLADLRDFEAMNRVYATFFPEPPPARACVEVAALPRGARVEIDVTALGKLGIVGLSEPLCGRHRSGCTACTRAGAASRRRGSSRGAAAGSARTFAH